MFFTPASRITAGAKLLDRNVSGWEDRIDLDKLDLSTHDCCMLGQLFGSYSKGLEDLNIGNPSRYGFFTGTTHGPRTQRDFLQYDKLKRIWTNLIRKRTATYA